MIGEKEGRERTYEVHKAQRAFRRNDKTRQKKHTMERRERWKKRNNHNTIRINPIVIRISIVVDSIRNEIDCILNGKTNEITRRHTHTHMERYNTGSSGTEWWIFAHIDVGAYELAFGHILYWVHVDINRARNIYRFISLTLSTLSYCCRSIKKSQCYDSQNQNYKHSSFFLPFASFRSSPSI